jgi:hypothetical protein
MKKIIFYTFIIILLISITIPIFSVPEKNDVEKTVKNQIEKELNKNKRNQLIGGFFSSIGKIINATSTFIFIAIIIFIVVTIVLIVTNIIIRNITTSKYAAQINNAIIEEHKETVFNENKFNELIKKNEFSKAIIYLHRCTIFYLLRNKITYNKNMTNFTLYNKIKDNSLKNAFKKIYISSEKILFDDYTADNSDLLACKDLYYKNFLIENI